MDIKYFCPRWGYSHLPIPQFIDLVKKSGFDGVEMTVNVNQEEKSIWRELLAENELLFIGQMVEAGDGKDFHAHLLETELYIKNLVSLNPIKINTFTGRDYFSFEQNCQLIQHTLDLEKQLGIPIVHEIHRGRFSYSPVAIESYLVEFPELRLNADFSHWCCVSESYMQEPDLKMLVSRAISRADHIHARIGHPQGPQVNDPRAPEWADALEYHFQWWEDILSLHHLNETELFAITPEFGPVPYFPAMPYTRQPLADQWEINVWMMKTLKEKFNKQFKN